MWPFRRAKQDERYFERSFVGSFLKNAERLVAERGHTLERLSMELSCIVGGQMAAESALKAGQLKDAWGQGSVEEALKLSRLFALAMLSRCFDFETVEDRRKKAITIESICGWHEPTFLVKDFMKVDSQYQADRKGETLGLFELTLVYDLALAYCGVQTGIDIRRASFPLQSYADVITTERRAGAMPDDIILLANAFVVGQQAASGYLEDVLP